MAKGTKYMAKGTKYMSKGSRVPGSPGMLKARKRKK